ncbi:tryptophan-rich sensory protein [Demequina sp.]|uniref:tryptophan-rich sensory protein n=1 Tax=Demequina sp. TaxID=2050685 RepID=UPI003D11E2F7
MASDRVRQVLVAVGAALAIAGAAWGSGAFGGTPIEDAAGGALAPDATLLAPGSTAFSIWSVIYAFLVLFAVVQALPSRAAEPRYRAVSWWVLASMVLNAAWIAVVQAGWLWLSVVVLGAIVVVLVLVALRLDRSEPAGPLDTAATEVAVGLYLGWTSVALAANLAAALDGVGTALAIVLTAVVTLAGSGFAWWLLRRALGASVALAMAWGAAWIGFARLDDPRNLAVVTAAIAGATLLAVVGVARAIGQQNR